MRLKVESLPNPSYFDTIPHDRLIDRRGRESDGPGHRSQAPVRRIPRCRLQRQTNGLGDLIVSDLARRPWTGLVQESVDPTRRKSPSRLANRIGRDPLSGANTFVVHAFGRQQDNPRALSQPLRRPPTRRQPLKFAPLAFRQIKQIETAAPPIDPSSANQRTDNPIYFSFRILARAVYCKDINRPEENSDIQFTFLGYTFRPRKAVDKYGRVYVNFSPAVSPDALTAMRQTIRGWRLQLKSDKSLADLSFMLRPILNGWLQYYGHFHGSALKSVWRRVNRSLIGWLMRKHKKLAGHKTRAVEMLKRLAQGRPRAFVHWSMGYLS
jgi:Group II intron, maturase-specific domain